MSEDKWMDPTDAAKKLDVTVNTIRRALREKTLSGKKIMGRWKVYEPAVMKMLEPPTETKS